MSTWLALTGACLSGCAADGMDPAGGTGGTGGAGAASGAGAGGRLGTGVGKALCTRCDGCAEELPVASRAHVLTPVEYPDPPPVGGDHDQCWAPWGVHSDAVPARNWVHNLEHGGVVFLYNCPDGCDADLETFTGLARANSRTLLTPYAELKAKFALVAWGHRLLSDCVDLPVFQMFYDAHFNHAPEATSSDPPAGCP